MALLDWQLHLAQVDALLNLKGHDIDSSDDCGVVENYDFWVRLDVELQLFWTHYTVKTLASPWLDFS